MIAPDEKVLVVGPPGAGTIESLTAAGYQVIEANDQAAALAKFSRDDAVTIVVIGVPPVQDVPEFVAALYDADRRGLVILGQGRPEQCDQFRQHTVTLFLPLPWCADDLLARVRARRIHMGLMNLHDAFLTANMVKGMVKRSPLISDDAEAYTMSDRGRAERL